jgi:DNA-binding transcriptional ArsR family regulator
MSSRKGRGKAMIDPKGKHVRGRAMTPALISALDHPVRREVLRLLHRHDTHLSPIQMNEKINVGISCLSYHARTLAEQKVTRLASTMQVRGATQHFYVSKVADNELVATILNCTEKDDGFIRERARGKKRNSG